MQNKGTQVEKVKYIEQALTSGRARTKIQSLNSQNSVSVYIYIFKIYFIMCQNAIPESECIGSAASHFSIDYFKIEINPFKIEMEKTSYPFFLHTVY